MCPAYPPVLVGSLSSAAQAQPCVTWVIYCTRAKPLSIPQRHTFPGVLPLPPALKPAASLPLAVFERLLGVEGGVRTCSAAAEV